MNYATFQFMWLTQLSSETLSTFNTTTTGLTDIHVLVHTGFISTFLIQSQHDVHSVFVHILYRNSTLQNTNKTLAEAHSCILWNLTVHYHIQSHLLID